MEQVLEYSRENCNLSIALGTYTTVLQPEMIDITLDASKVLYRYIGGKNVTIYSDSKAVLLTLDKPRMSSKLILECAKLVVVI